MQTANKGEWSEFYVFLKIISERRVFSADKTLAIIPNKYLTFHNIIREELSGIKKIYLLEGLAPNSVKISDVYGKELLYFEDSDLPSKIGNIFNSITHGDGSSFTIPEATSLMESLNCTKIKASGSRKEDIVGIVEDRVSPGLEELGFSIKSMLGGASTLLNAGNTTNFIFKIEGFSGDIALVNNIEGSRKIRDRLQQIYKMGGKFIYTKLSSDIFSKNLKKIDTHFATMLAHILLHYYQGDGSSISDLVKMASRGEYFTKNDHSESDLEYKMKMFLDAVALGMVPGSLWAGESSAKGGYIIVKKDGEIVCYHIYNKDEFKSYLYESTKLDTPSSTRHGYGKIYVENGELLFNLNLQIRF